MPVDEVRIFLDEADVPGDYEEIALVTSRSDASWTDETDLIRAMQRRAAKLGADAIIVGEIREPSTIERVAEVFTEYEAPRRGRSGCRCNGSTGPISTFAALRD